MHTITRVRRALTVQAIATAAVVLVAAAAAAISYSHMQHLAADAGEGWRSHLLPLSVDGLIVAASMAMYVRRRADRTVGALVYGSLAAGIAASLAANVATPLIAAGELPRWVPALVAAWPPVALVLGYELLMGLIRPTDVVEVPLAEPEPVPIAEPAATDAPTAETPPPTHEPARHEPGPSIADQRAAARSMYQAEAARGHQLTGRELAARFAMSERWGRDRIAEAKRARPIALFAIEDTATS